MQEPVFSDILEAKRVIDRYLQPTPMHHYPRLSADLGFDVFIKHENHQPVGAFKVRGGINLISRLTEHEKKAGVISASTGNHGQSIAYAAKLFGVKAIIGMPLGSNPDKVAAIRSLGASVEFHGKDFDEAREWVEEQARTHGYRYVHSANEPLLIAGVGTIGLEMLYARPGLDVIIAPIGGGSGAAGSSIAAKTINPKIRMIGVQSAHAPAVHESWRSRKMLSSKMCDTFAEGMATRQAFELTLGILIRNLDDFILVTDDELFSSIRLLFEHTHNIAEGAGAAALAAAVKIKAELSGKKVGLDLSGGNVTAEILKKILLNT
jgi:threonine dehydratase